MFLISKILQTYSKKKIVCKEKLDSISSLKKISFFKKLNNLNEDKITKKKGSFLINFIFLTIV